MALFKRILVPHDFSAHATRALKVAAELAGGDGKLVVLHAIAPVYGALGLPTVEEVAWAPTEDLVTQLRQRLENLVAKTVPAGGPSARCRVVLGEPLAAILEAAAAVDSIVMTTVGRTGLAHLLIGSVAERVVRHAPVPVLTLHPPKPRDTGKAGGRRRARRS